jgi:class 3 adenylate cyclase
MALFRELFPKEVLSADQIVSVAHITVMRVQIHGTQQLYESLGDSAAFDKIRAALQGILGTVKEHSGAVVKTIGEGVLASFPDSISAVQAAVTLLHQSKEPEMPIAAVIHSGTAMVATLEDRLDYFGKTLQTLERILDTSAPQTLLLTSNIAETPEVQTYFREQQIQAELNPEIQLWGGVIILQVRF